MKNDVGEVAGRVLESLMKDMKLRKVPSGPQFTNSMLDVLSLCTSEMIKAGYCRGHYEEAVIKFMDQIKDDLEINRHEK